MIWHLSSALLSLQPSRPAEVFIRGQEQFGQRGLGLLPAYQAVGAELPHPEGPAAGISGSVEERRVEAVHLHAAMLVRFPECLGYLKTRRAGSYLARPELKSCQVGVAVEDVAIEIGHEVDHRFGC